MNLGAPAPEPGRRADPDDVGAFSSMLASGPLRGATFALVALVCLPVFVGRVHGLVGGRPPDLSDGALALLAAVLGVWGRGLLRATRAGPTRNEAALDAVDAAASPVDDLEAQALAAGEGGEGPNHDADVDDADVDDADVANADVANADVDDAEFDDAADRRAPDAP